MVDVTYDVLANIDDAFCDANTSYVNDPVSAVTLTFGKYMGVVNRAFVRFRSMIPQGAKISSATLKVTSAATLNWTSFLPVIRLVDIDNCPDFLSNPFNLPVSVLGVQFDAKYWVARALYSLDVALLVQEFVNRSGYVPGNYIGLRIDEGNSVLSERQAGYQKGTTGTSCQLVVSYVPVHIVTFDSVPIPVQVTVDSVPMGLTPVTVELDEASHSAQVPSSQQG